MTDLVAVVVNYFSSDLTLQLIKQLRSQISCLDSEIVCIDNSCDQIEAKRLTEMRASLGFSLIISSKNLGYGTAVNRTLNEREFRRALILNADVCLKDNAVKDLFRFSIEYPDSGIWGGVTTHDSINLDFRHAWRDPSILRNIIWSLGLKRWLNQSIFTDDYRAVHKDTPYQVDSVSGCCMMISGKAWKSLLGFDEQFFLYSEEIDLCYRSKKLGYQPIVVPSVRLNHKKPDAVENLDKLAMMYTGKVFFAEKHFSPLRASLYRHILLFGALIRASVYGVMPSEKKRAKVWFSIVSNLFFNRCAY